MSSSVICIPCAPRVARIFCKRPRKSAAASSAKLCFFACEIGFLRLCVGQFLRLRRLRARGFGGLRVLFALRSQTVRIPPPAACFGYVVSPLPCAPSRLHAAACFEQDAIVIADRAAQDDARHPPLAQRRRRYRHGVRRRKAGARVLSCRRTNRSTFARPARPAHVLRARDYPRPDRRRASASSWRADVRNPDPAWPRNWRR